VSATHAQDTSLIEALSVLWPHAEVGRGPRHSAAGGLDYLVLPGGRQTAVPRSPAAVSARAVGHSSAASGPRATALRLGLSGALRLGLGSVARDRIHVTGSAAGSLAELLGSLLGEEVRLAVSTGTARVNRKPVVEVFGADGRTRGFVKLGLSTVAWDDVRAEAEALRQVAGLVEHGIVVPTLLRYGTWRGMPYLLMTGVPQARWHRRRDRHRPPVREMRALTDAFAQPAEAPADTGWLDGVRGRLLGLADPAWRDTALDCLTALVRATARRPVPLSAWHGDWTPWNMARSRGRLSLWDWERFATGVPAGLDALHHVVNTSDAGTPEAVRRSLRRAEPVWRAVVGRSPDAEVASGLYLAAMAARYLPLAEGEGGRFIAGRAQVFLAAWWDWSRTR